MSGRPINRTLRDAPAKLAGERVSHLVGVRAQLLVQQRAESRVVVDAADRTTNRASLNKTLQGFVNGVAAAQSSKVALGKRPTATGPLDGPKRRCFSGVRDGQLSGHVRINIIVFGHLQVLSI